MVEWYHHSLPTIHHLMDMSLSKLRELVADREALACCIPVVTKSLIGLSD